MRKTDANRTRYARMANFTKLLSMSYAYDREQQQVRKLLYSYFSKKLTFQLVLRLMSENKIFNGNTTTL
jgi:hypothetical protein